MSVRSTCTSREYSINSSSTFASTISWSQITQHKWGYIAMVWLTIISAGIYLMSIVWNSDKDPWNNIQNLSYLTNSQLCYMLGIFKCTWCMILFICLKFIAQYFIRPAIEAHQLKPLPGIKHKKNQMDQPSDPLLIPKDDQKYDRVPNAYKNISNAKTISNHKQINGTTSTTLTHKQSNKIISPINTLHEKEVNKLFNYASEINLTDTDENCDEVVFFEAI
eukprot:57474_1